MAVKVKISFHLRRFTDGQEFVEVTGNTPLECIHDVESQFPGIKQYIYDKHGDLRPQLQFFVNGQIIYANKLNDPLKDGDELFILLAIGGG
jgi:sulfur-carrier protein